MRILVSLAPRDGDFLFLKILPVFICIYILLAKKSFHKELAAEAKRRWRIESFESNLQFSMCDPPDHGSEVTAWL
jgi:hypothetical protein